MSIKSAIGIPPSHGLNSRSILLPFLPVSLMLLTAEVTTIVPLCLFSHSIPLIIDDIRIVRHRNHEFFLIWHLSHSRFSAINQSRYYLKFNQLSVKVAYYITQFYLPKSSICQVFSVCNLSQVFSVSCYNYFHVLRLGCKIHRDSIIQSIPLKALKRILACYGSTKQGSFSVIFIIMFLADQRQQSWFAI